MTGSLDAHERNPRIQEFCMNVFVLDALNSWIPLLILSVGPAQFDAFVIGLQDVFEAQTGSCHAKRSNLAQPHAMPPAPAVEGEAFDQTFRIVGASDSEKSVFEPQGDPDPVSIENSGPTAPGHANPYRPARIAQARRFEVPNLANTRNQRSEFLGNDLAGKRSLPHGQRGKPVA